MRVTHGLGHHEVDPSAEDPLEVFLEAEVGVERIRCTRGEVDEDVHITVLGPEMAAGCRAEQAEAPHVVRATRTSDRFTVQTAPELMKRILLTGYRSYLASAGGSMNGHRSRCELRLVMTKVGCCRSGMGDRVDRE